MERVLVAPAVNSEGELLAVRPIRLPSDLDDLTSTRAIELDASERDVESARDALLSIDDVPIPFRSGLFGNGITWVSSNPVDALLLQSLGLNATSLAEPFMTLGTKEGLWHLQDIGVLSPRSKGRGTLVVVEDDPNRRLTPEQKGLLNGQFREVLNPSRGDFSGRGLWSLVGGGLENDAAFRDDPLGTLVGWMKENGETPLRAEPVPLPPRPDGATWEGSRLPFTFVPVSELFHQKPPGPRWLVEGFISPGTITQFLGGSKAGKSTLLLSMLAEVSRGGVFLGKTCPKGRVLYVTEQGRRSFGDSLERSLPRGTTAADLPDLLALTAETLYGRSWANVLALVRATVKQTGAKVVVFDTLSEAADVHGDAENSAGASRMLYRSLRGLLSGDVAVVAVRHTRKDERGGIAESGLGSVANSGAADHLVRVREPHEGSTVRRIDTKGRISDAEDFLLDLTPSGWVRVKHGTSEVKREARDTGLRTLIVEEIKAKGVTGLLHRDLMAALESSAPAAGLPVPGRTAVDRVLTALVSGGHIAEEKTTGQGRPKLFRFISASTPSGVGSEREER